jgi:hypothetical protein
MRRAAILLTLALLLLGGAMALKGRLLELPKLPERQLAADEFDTRRALSRLKRILGEERPHPVDSGEGDRVRERLLAELRAVGLQPRVTDNFVCGGSDKDRTVSCARIRNVVATVGPTAGKHVLLASHYDSTPVGPGASDDGIGYASMFEIAALLRNKRLARPVTFLFDEGEESGLLGASAFLQHDPLAARVDSLINLESRGVDGPAIMFETSRPNGAALAAYGAGVKRPAANSLTTDFYRLIPNSTDVAVFEKAGWTTLNFAVIGNETRYHSPGDTFDALDPRSLRHMGEQALSSTKALASGPPKASGGERIYTDLVGKTLITTPFWLGATLLGLLILALAWQCRRLPGGIARSIAATGAALIGSLTLALLAQTLLGLTRSGDYWRAHPETTAIAIYVSAAAASVLALIWLARAIALDRMRAGFWLLFVLIGAALAFVAPGAIIFFLLPPALGLASSLADTRSPRVGWLLALLAWASLFLTWGPLLHLSEALLDMDAAWVFAPVAALIMLPFLIEAKPLAARLRRRDVAGAAIAAVAVAWFAVTAGEAYSPNRKQQFSIEYESDAASGQARWLVYHDGAELPAAFKALGQPERDVEVPWSSRERWALPAKGPAYPAPELANVSVRTVAGGRAISAEVRMNGAEVLRIRAEPGTRLVAGGIGAVRRFGRGEAEEDYILRCHGRSCDGARLSLLTASAAPVELIVMGVRSGLPAEARPLLAARPANAAPQYAPDSTIALRRVRL